MSSVPYSKDGIIAWVNQTAEGKERFAAFCSGQTVEEFLSDEGYVSKFLGLMAHTIQYPGDGNWPGFHLSTASEIQISELARIVRKLLPHVPDDVPFKAKVRDYLVRKGLTGNILRSSGEASKAQE